MKIRYILNILLLLIICNACKHSDIDAFDIVEKITDYDTVYSDKNDIFNRITDMVVRDSIAGLMKMAVSDEMICFTYSAESYAKANKTGFISNEILCFNWKGEKIKKYLLPFPVSTFCVDEHFIYGVRYVDDESIIYRFKL